MALNRALLTLLALAHLSVPGGAALLAYYPFDSGFHDASGNGNHLTASSGTPDIITTAGDRRVGTGALHLEQSGTQEHLAFTTPFDFNGTTPWSMAWWGKRSPSAAAPQGMIAGTITDSNNFVWTPNNPAVVQGIRLRGLSTATTTDYSGIPDDNAFHHWAVSYDGAGQVTVWRDNVPLGTKAFSGAVKLTHAGAGTATIANSFYGSIDELHLYDEAINAAKVNELFTAGSPPPPPVTVKRLRVFLLCGQSNADGRATSSELPATPVNLQQPQPDVALFYRIEGGTATLTTLRPGLSETSQFGPEIILGRIMADLWSVEPETRVAIIKYANGGTNLHLQWKAGGNATTAGDGPEYLTFQQTVTQGLAALAAAYPGAALDLQGLVWMQGESDAVNGYQNQYQTNLTTFIADTRATYGADLPFIVGRLSSGQTSIAAGPLEVVRAAQTAVAAAGPRISLIDTDSFGMKTDNLHFDGAGQQALGKASAAALISYLPFPSPPALQRLGNGDFEVTLADCLPGLRYSLENNATLLPGGWAEGDSKTATGPTVILNFTPGTGQTKRYFRIKRTASP